MFELFCFGPVLSLVLLFSTKNKDSWVRLKALKKAAKSDWLTLQFYPKGLTHAINWIKPQPGIPAYGFLITHIWCISSFAGQSNVGSRDEIG